MTSLLYKWISYLQSWKPGFSWRDFTHSLVLIWFNHDWTIWAIPRIVITMKALYCKGENNPEDLYDSRLCLVVSGEWSQSQLNCCKGKCSALTAATTQTDQTGKIRTKETSVLWMGYKQIGLIIFSYFVRVIWIS